MKYIVILLFGFSFTHAQNSSEWIKFFYHSDNSIEQIGDAAFDNSGNIFLSGYGYFVDGGQGEDFLTIKVNPNGDKEWTKIYNGTGNNTDRPYKLHADDSGNVYVTGTTRISNNKFKIVTIKYAPDSSIIWTSIYDSASVSDGEAYAVTVDPSGNSYITGRFSSNQQVTNDNLITLKIDPSGSPINWNYYEQLGNQSDKGDLITIDNFGDIIVAGDSYSGNENGREIVVIKYNDDLDTLWTAHINGTDNSLNEFAVDLIADDTTNIFLLARIQNDTTGTDFALIKFNSNGEILWRTEFDANGGQDIPEAMAIDDDGNIFITGRARRIIYNDMVILKYNNSGEEVWTYYYDGPNNLDDDPIDINLDDDGNIYVCGESNRDGSNFKFIVIKLNAESEFQWQYVYGETENISSKAIKVKADNSGYIYAAGEGEGLNGNYDLIAVKLSTLTGVEVLESETANSFKLSQNFPNPFNPTTKIKYTIPSSQLYLRGNTGQFITLKIYDVLGREVAILANEVQPPGTYEVTFDASSAGGGLSSGIYLYKLSAGEGSIEIKKMVLMK